MRKALLSCALISSLAMFSSGCIKQMLVDGQIEGTREASSSFDRVGDYELARSGAESGLVQFEGMLQLSPHNKDALFMLAKGWAGYGYGFIEDDLEAAEDAHNDDAVEYHRKRAKRAYDTAIGYGLELLNGSASGFDQARKNDGKLREWLKANFTSKKDADTLFWLGYAWLVRADLMKGDDTVGAELVADLFVGVDMLERVNELDPSYEHYNAPTALAAYHARSAMAEMDQAKQMFDDIGNKTTHLSLIVPFTYATTYACSKGDATMYVDLLRQVEAANDPDPAQRLTNTIAKRRAHRWLRPGRMKESCGFDPPPHKS